MSGKLNLVTAPPLTTSAEVQICKPLALLSATPVKLSPTTRAARKAGIDLTLLCTADVDGVIYDEPRVTLSKVQTETSVKQLSLEIVIIMPNVESIIDKQ